MNRYLLSILSQREYESLISGKTLPLWANEYSLQAYSDRIILAVKKNDILLATFIVPLFFTDNQVWIKRKYRFIPYMMPYYWVDTTALQKKQINVAIFDFLFKKYDFTYIPLHPDYLECAAIASLGGFVEMRQTHIITQIPKYSDSIKRKVKKSQKKVKVTINNNPEKFDFAKAIKGSQEEIIERSLLSTVLMNDGKAITFLGEENNSITAGVYIAIDREWVYLLHSWRNHDADKGIISLLITQAVEYSFEKIGCKYFDFEGSVIDSIDDFFTSFTNEIITYPYIHYAKNRNELMNIIFRSMDIPGRINKN